MISKQLEVDENKRKGHIRTYIIFIVVVTGILIAFRIVFSCFESELSDIFFWDLLITNRDRNFISNYYLMKNGIFDYYQTNPFTDEKGIYLYFWYFLFFPFSLLPLEISLYIWDIFRLISTIYIAFNVTKLTSNKRELSYFFIFSGIGYIADMYLNNTNWMIQFFLFESYIQLNKKNKLLSGILFTLSTFKITIIIFPLLLIIVKKIKSKDLFYYFIPLTLISIPYLIFPEYFFSMFSNWVESTESTSGVLLLDLTLATWRLIQPAHLMYISIILIVIIINIEDEKLRKKFASLIYVLVFVFWVVSWLIILELALFI